MKQKQIATLSSLLIIAGFLLVTPTYAQTFDPGSTYGQTDDLHYQGYVNQSQNQSMAFGAVNTNTQSSVQNQTPSLPATGGPGENSMDGVPDPAAPVMNTPGQTDDLHYQGYLNTLRAAQANANAVMSGQTGLPATGGAVTTPGLPETGLGGNAMFSLFVLLASAGVIVAGMGVLRNMKNV